MVVMSLWLEGEEATQDRADTQVLEAGIAETNTMRLDTNPVNYGDEDLLGLGSDDETDSGDKSSEHPSDEFEVVVPRVCEVVVPVVVPMVESTISSNVDFLQETKPKETESLDFQGIASISSNVDLLQDTKSKETESLDFLGSASISSNVDLLQDTKPKKIESLDFVERSASLGAADNHSAKPEDDTVIDSKTSLWAASVQVEIKSETQEFNAKEAFTVLATQPSGMLFRDHLISVKMQQEYRGSQARIFFECESVKHKREAFGLSLLGIRASIGLQNMASNAIRFQLQNPPPVLETGGTFRICLMLECMQPFSTIPSLNLSFTANSAEEHRHIFFPVTMLKFVEPVSFGDDDIKAHWLEMSNKDGLEAIDTIISEHCHNPHATAHQIMEKVTAVANLATFYVQGHNEVYAAGTFNTGTINDAGDKIAVGCIFKITTDDAVLDVSIAVRTPLPSVSSQFLKTILKTISRDSFFSGY